MVRAIRSGFRVPAAATVALALIATGQAPTPDAITAPYTTWKDYGGSADSMTARRNESMALGISPRLARRRPSSMCAGA